MGTVNNNGGTLISFGHPNNPLHVVSSRIPSHHPNGCANFTFQIPSIANTSKRNANSAERRANHNAVERARRECLNTKFQELAHALPSLSQVRRPSKSIIVQKSLEFINNVRRKEGLLEKEMQEIRAENESLREEVNSLRKQLGMDPLPLPPPSSSSPLTREDSKPSDNSSNTSSPLPSPSTSSTSSPHLQQLTDERKEDVGTNKITTTMMLQSSETINLEADNHIITSVTPTTTTLTHDNNIISNNINAMNNNHNNNNNNNNTNSANLIIRSTTTTDHNNNNNNSNNNNCNVNYNGNSNCGDNNARFVNIKNEHINDDYDIMDISEKLGDKNILDDQNINDSQHVIYNGLIYHPTTLLNSNIDQHTGYSPEFDFSVDISQIIVSDPLQIQFDHSEMTDATNDLSAYCNPFSLNQKIYPSPPPCEASIINSISDYQLLHDNHNI